MEAAKRKRQGHACTRNESERIRRDKLKTYIMQLGRMVPSVVTAKKRLNKVNILRLTVNYLRIHYDLGALQSVTRQWRPDFLQHDMLNSLIGESTDGFLLIVDNNGIIVFASEATVTCLGFNVIDLLNESITDILHPSDIEEFQSQFAGRREGDGPPENENAGGRACATAADGHQRSFYVRLRNNCDGLKDKYSTVHIHGQLKVVNQPAPAEPEGARNTGPSAEQYLVGVCRLVGEERLRGMEPYSVCDMEQWATRHSIIGNIWDSDARLTLILGFLPSEVIEVSGYNFVHEEDIPYMKYTHVNMVGAYTETTTRCFHRCFTKSSETVYLYTDSVCVFDNWTKKPKYIVGVHTLVTQAKALEQLKKQQEFMLSEEARVGQSSNDWDPLAETLSQRVVTHSGQDAQRPLQVSEETRDGPTIRREREGSKGNETAVSVNADAKLMGVLVSGSDVSDVGSLGDSNSSESEGDVTDRPTSETIQRKNNNERAESRANEAANSGDDDEEHSNISDDVEFSSHGGTGSMGVNNRYLVRKTKDPGLYKKADPASGQQGLQLMQARLAQQLKEKQAFLERSINKQEKELNDLRVQFEKHEVLTSDPAFATHLQIICQLEEKRQKQKQLLVQLKKEYAAQTATMFKARLSSDGDFTSPSWVTPTATITGPPSRAPDLRAPITSPPCEKRLPNGSRTTYPASVPAMSAATLTESLSVRAGLDVCTEISDDSHTRCSVPPGSASRGHGLIRSATNTTHAMPNHPISFPYNSYVNQVGTSRGQHCSNHQGAVVTNNEPPSASPGVSVAGSYDAAEYFGELFQSPGQSQGSGTPNSDTTAMSYRHTMPVAPPPSEITPPLPSNSSTSHLLQYSTIPQSISPSLQGYTTCSNNGMPERDQSRLASHQFLPLHSHATLPPFVNSPRLSQLTPGGQQPDPHGACMADGPLTSTPHFLHQTTTVAGVRENLCSLVLTGDNFEDMTATMPAMEPTPNAIAMVADSLTGLDSEELGQYMGPGCNFNTDMANTGRKDVPMSQMATSTESLYWRAQSVQGVDFTRITSLDHHHQPSSTDVLHSHHQAQHMMALQAPDNPPNYWML